MSDSLLNAVMFLAMFVCALVFFVDAFIPIEWTALLASLGGILLSISFAYGAALQQMFDALYMLFFGALSLPLIANMYCFN